MVSAAAAVPQATRTLSSTAITRWLRRSKRAFGQTYSHRALPEGKGGRERGSLAAHVRENLKALGLQRRMKTPSLTEILAADAEHESQANGVDHQGAAAMNDEVNDLGVCPTSEHSVTYPQCGYAGCVDLRVWAKAYRYRYRLEESYKAESNMHVKGDGRWFVEIVCKNGLIYPYGGTTLLAYANRGAVSDMAKMANLGVATYQKDGRVRSKCRYERGWTKGFEVSG
jgi:hypothetical protein